MGTKIRKVYLDRRYEVDLDGRYIGWVYKVNAHRWRAYVDDSISPEACREARANRTTYAATSDRHRTRKAAVDWLARTAPRYL